MNLHTSPSSLGSGRASFTLIELLIVIAIVAVLSVVVILSLNPAELLRQAWDSNRIADMNTLNRILTYTRGNVGTTSTVYFSIVDPAATSTSGTDCAGVGGLVPPSGWTYHCAASSTLRAVDGTGWLPLDLSSPGFGGSISGLPVDPTNTSSSGLYYMFVRGASGYAVAAGLQSQKFLGPRGSGDDGYDPGRLEMGSNLSLIAQSQGLVGWWPMEDGSGTSVRDSSPSAWNGALVTGTSTQSWSAGKVGGGLVLDGADDYIEVDNQSGLRPTGAVTVVAWIKPDTVSGTKYVAGVGDTGNYGYFLLTGNSGMEFNVGNGSAGVRPTGANALAAGTWAHVVGTYDGSTAKLYVNGTLVDTQSLAGPIAYGSLTDFLIGQQESVSAVRFFNGTIDDVRTYNRPLTAAEVAAIYNAQR